MNTNLKYLSIQIVCVKEVQAFSAPQYVSKQIKMHPSPRDQTVFMRPTPNVVNWSAILR